MQNIVIEVGTRGHPAHSVIAGMTYIYNPPDLATLVRTSTLTNWVSQTPPVRSFEFGRRHHPLCRSSVPLQHAWYTKFSSKNYKLLTRDTCNMQTRTRILFTTTAWIPYAPLKIRPVLDVQNSSCRKINHTRTYGRPDLLGVYDIQETIYNYLEDNMLQIFPRFMEKHHTFRPETPIYNEVISAHASTNILTAFKRPLKP